MLLKGKSAVITGCSKGIGEKTLEIFSREGANIFACVRKADTDFKKKIKNFQKKYKNQIIPVEFDLSNSANAKKSADKIILNTKNIDILVNNAGIVQTSLFAMTPARKIKELFEINFFSHITFTQYLLKPMMRNKKGSIIFISSTSGLDGNIGRSTYSASKASLIALSKSMGRELGPYNIRVNCVAPGLIDTQLMRNNTNQKNIDLFVESTSLKKIGTTEEVANPILFLASDLSTYITGQTIRIDGGI